MDIFVNKKSFADIPWKREMAVLDLLQAAGSANPGLKFEFVKSFVDRGGRDVGSVVSIDEVKADIHILGFEPSKWQASPGANRRCGDI